MKKLISSSIAIFMAFMLITSCSQENETVAPDVGEAEISVAALLEASLKQMVQSNGKVAAERTITGTLTANNLDEGTSEEYDWYAVIDEDAFTVSSSKTIAMEPGVYDFSLVLADGNHAYAGMALAEEISEGDNVVSMTLKPVFGDVNVDFTVYESANLKLSYPVEDLALLSNPFIGLSINDGPERIYQINDNTGFSNTWINLAFGEYKFVLTLYDGEQVIGRSNPDQQMVNVAANQDILIDLLPLYAEVMFDLNLEGGEVTFNFVLPQPVVDEVGELDNLQAVFLLNSTVNGDQEVLLNFTGGEGGFTATHTFTDFQYDIVNLSLVFSDIATGDEIGYSSESGVILSSETQDLTMELDLRRRAIVSGRILAVLGVNVFDLGNAAVGGAEVYVDDDLVGITGSGAFGTAGYLRVFLTQGTYTITAVNTETGFYGEEIVSIAPLDVTNVDIILDQEQLGVGLLVRQERYGYNGQYSRGFEGLNTKINNTFSEVSEVPNYEDLNQLLEFEALYLNMPGSTGIALSSTEISNIQSFIASGGKAVFLGDGAGWSTWNSSVAAVVGGNYIGDNTGLAIISKINDEPLLTDNVQNIQINAGSNIGGGNTLFGNGEIALWLGNKALTILDVNVVDDVSLELADNRQFMENTIEWLND